MHAHTNAYTRAHERTSAQTHINAHSRAHHNYTHTNTDTPTRRHPPTELGGWYTHAITMLANLLGNMWSRNRTPIRGISRHRYDGRLGGDGPHVVRGYR